ncbi:MAG: ABC transporter substrate-binding protein [Patescibacteria group bacterium]
MLSFLKVIRKVERFVFVFFLLLGLFSGAAWWRLSYLENTKVVPASGGVLREVLVGQPQSLNPLFGLLNDADRDVSELIFAGLLKYDYNGSLSNDLAKDYKISKDGKTYEFTLKDNLFWSDGQEITVQDVTFTLGIIQDSAVQSPLKLAWQEVKVEKKDDRTVKFILPTAYPPFLENFTLKILPYHVFNNIEPQDLIAKPPQNIACSGPFEVNIIETDEENKIKKIIFRRNQNFHGKEAFLESLELTFVQNNTEVPDWRNRANAFTGILPIQEEQFQKNFNINKLSIPRYFALFLNQDNKILSQRDVREALTLATPKNEIIDRVLLGEGRVINSPLLPENRVAGSFEKYEFNLKGAKKILDEAGWKDANKDSIREKVLDGANKATSLKLTLFTVDQDELKNAAAVIQESWKEIGVRLDVKAIEATKLLQENIKERQYDILLFGQGLSFFADPYAFWSSSQIEYPGLNLSLYKNDRVDTLLKEARQESNNQKRKSLLRGAQKQITDDIPAIFLYSPYYLYVLGKEVKGFDGQYIIDPSKRFIDIENWYINEKRVEK